MVQARFLDFVTDVFDYFERKRPNDNTMDLWFDEVRNIPDEALEWIKSRIFKENDNKPSNLPATMWALYNAWLQANPHKRAFTEEKDCPDCEGGWLVLQKRIDGYKQPISHSAPCGRCKQIPNAYYLTLEEAERKGYKRTDLRASPWDGKSVKQVADAIGKPVPMPRVYAD